MNVRNVVVVVCLSLAAVALYGQPVVIGDLGQADANVVGLPPNGTTYIDISHPATGAGAINHVTFHWASAVPCSSIRIKFFRPQGGSIHMTQIAERGPIGIGATTGDVAADLATPVNVEKGDLIGVYLAPGCGAIGVSYGRPEEMLLGSFTNYSGGALPADASLVRGERLDVRGSTDQFALVGIVPAVGALAGSNGATFRTTIQLQNPSGFNIRPRIVYHPAGQSAAASDPFLAVNLPPYNTSAVEFADAFHITGLGSLDVITASEPAPTVNARVYNDTGSGTNGFNEAMIPVSAALHNGEYGSIIFPSDPSVFRMNIGIRTLGNGAQINVSTFDATGHTLVAAFGKTYPPNYFEQVPIQTFIGAAPPTNGGVLLQIIGGGDAIIYVSTTDNRTNDSAITIVERR